MTDLVLVIDEYNKVDMKVLEALGIEADKDEINFEDIVNYEFKAVLNDDYYKRVGNFFTVSANPSNMNDLYNNENSITLKISGIVRLKNGVNISLLPSGISYSDDLAKYFIEKSKDSEVVKAQEEANYNIFTGESFSDNQMNLKSTKENILASLGGSEIPYIVTIYPKDFTTKDEVLAYLDKWNDNKDKEDYIVYNDMASTFVSLSSGIMDAITLVLVAFAAISLVVSLIMVGIITYISVLERTKEIGILRALGARKKDIARVFNAETFIVGSLSGLLGILIAYGLTFPINSILYKTTELENIAVLNPIHAIILIVISVSLTMLGGSIPAKIASKKDPVEALRTE